MSLVLGAGLSGHAGTVSTNSLSLAFRGQASSFSGGYPYKAAPGENVPLTAWFNNQDAGAATGKLSLYGALDNASRDNGLLGPPQEVTFPPGMTCWDLDVRVPGRALPGQEFDITIAFDGPGHADSATVTVFVR